MEELSKIQQEAVMCENSNELILAGAGSGKTRVLTYKIAYLLSRGVAPERIMALTFTNKAAKEMKQRLSAMVGEDLVEKISMGTFHSVFAKILKIQSYWIGYNSRFTIYDEADSRQIIKRIIKDFNFDIDTYKPARIHARISMAKNNLISVEQYMKDKMILENDIKDKMQYCGTIYQEYQKRLKAANCMDFDDLLQLVYTLFIDKPSIRSNYAYDYDYILVDEFQDTNVAQMQILQLLHRPAQALIVVGDDSQSIYSFRGANINNILMFSNIFENVKEFKLEQNYRSSFYIVAAANSLIQHNVMKLDKNVFSIKKKGELVHYLPFYNDRNEAEYIAQSIKEVMRVDACKWSDITILYRNNALTRCLEEALLQYKVPYQIHGGISFFDRKEVKNIISYFRLVCNPEDNEAFIRIVNYPRRGIGQQTIELLRLASQKYQTAMIYIAAEPDYFKLELRNGETKKKLQNWALKLLKYSQQEIEKDADDIANLIMDEMGIYDSVDREEDNVGKVNILNQIIDSIASYVQLRKDEERRDELFLHNYLQDIALLADEEESKHEDAVNLMTIHASKGLEYKTVYIIGNEENIFPSKKSSSSPQELEEERRLLYVAITRAEERCFLTSCQKRWIYGEEQRNEPSRFLNEISNAFMEEIDPYEVEEENSEKEDIQGYFD